LPDMLAKLPQHVETLKKRYEYISFHAPTNFSDEPELIEHLAMFYELGWNIVVHPDTIRDISLWRALGSYVCLENMDARKKTGRTANELYEFFDDLPQARLCFDIAHARQVDPTMTEAACILEEFGDRLAQVHLSEIDGRGVHFGMSLSAELAYEQFSDIIFQVPVILESIVNEEDIESEIDKTRMLSSHHLHSNSRTVSARSTYFSERVHVAGE
jgi:Xylose isomerase-like TIM barrel